MTEWVVATCMGVQTLVALFSIAWAWMVDTKNVALQARVAMLEDANTNWQQWARSEGFGQTKVIVTSRRVH